MDAAHVKLGVREDFTEFSLSQLVRLPDDLVADVRDVASSITQVALTGHSPAQEVDHLAVGFLGKQDVAAGVFHKLAHHIFDVELLSLVVK